MRALADCNLFFDSCEICFHLNLPFYKVFSLNVYNVLRLISVVLTTWLQGLVCFICPNNFSMVCSLFEHISCFSTVFIIYRCALCFICRSDTGISKGSSHSLLKRSTNQHPASSQAVSTDLSTIRLKKAGLAPSDGMGFQTVWFS